MILNLVAHQDVSLYLLALLFILKIRLSVQSNILELIMIIASNPAMARFRSIY